MTRPARHAIWIGALVALVAVPPLASADVQINVPARFLGGPIWNPLDPTTGLQPGARAGGPADPDGACIDGDPDCVVFDDEDALESLPVGDLEDPDRGLVFDLPETDDLIPDEIDGESVEEGGEDSATDGQGAQLLNARRPRAPVARPPRGQEIRAAYGRLRSPGPASWLRWQRPILRWRANPDADIYNVHVFRGSRRVLAAWTKRTRLRVPDGVLRQGRSYTWVVWPATGSRRNATYGAPIGHSTFAITLRPRIVFHTSGRGATVGEIRPRIPGARIALRAQAGEQRGFPRLVRANARSLFRLPVSRDGAEALVATLRDRGPRPPVGLRGGRPYRPPRAKPPTEPARLAARDSGLRQDQPPRGGWPDEV